MKLIGKFMLAAVAAIGFAVSAHAQTVITGSNITIATSGSYILGGNATTITINVGDVTLDLAGRTVASSHSCSLISNGTAPGCTCSVGSCATPTPGIKATGNNITIKNGIVEKQFGDGIAIFSPTGFGLVNAVVKDVTVSNNSGNGVAIYGNGAYVTNVQSYQNGHDGMNVADNARLEHITTSYNNGSGVNATAGSGSYTDIVTTYNKGIGIVANGNLTRMDAKFNAMQGIYSQGVLRDSTAEFNTGDGVYANQHGVVVDTVSAWNSGNGFTFGTSTCYTGLSAFSNTGVTISGGTALVGSTASCN